MHNSKNSEKKTNRDFKIIDSSGNVFTDLGFPAAEAENLLVQSFQSNVHKLKIEAGGKIKGLFGRACW